MKRSLEDRPCKVLVTPEDIENRGLSACLGGVMKEKSAAKLEKFLRDSAVKFWWGGYFLYTPNQYTLPELQTIYPAGASPCFCEPYIANDSWLNKYPDLINERSRFSLFLVNIGITPFDASLDEQRERGRADGYEIASMTEAAIFVLSLWERTKMNIGYMKKNYLRTSSVSACGKHVIVGDNNHARELYVVDHDRGNARDDRKTIFIKGLDEYLC